MTAIAHGSRSTTAAFMSTSWGAVPPTRAGTGATTARTSPVSFSPAGDSGSTDGTTDTHGPAAVR